MAITMDDVEELRRHLAELPRNNTRELTKQEAIALLASQLGSAKRRGYSPEELARMLSERGIPVNAPTLRGYLRRTRKSRKHRRGEPSSAASTNEAPPRAPSSTTATAPAPRPAPPQSAPVRQSEASGAATKAPTEPRGASDARSPER